MHVDADGRKLKGNGLGMGAREEKSWERAMLEASVSTAVRPVVGAHFLGGPMFRDDFQDHPGVGFPEWGHHPIDCIEGGSRKDAMISQSVL